MNDSQVLQAAELLWSTWKSGTLIDAIPEEYRPTDRDSAYKIQEKVSELSGSGQIGWKIAATSENGQKHIGVSGPLAGRLLADRAFSHGDTLELGENLMGVAEAEFCFRLGRDLPPRSENYSIEETLSAVDTLHPAIEIPDSRFSDFVTAGEYQLIADHACASWFILGNPTSYNWRDLDLVEHKVDALVDGVILQSGVGRNVLGDPRIALNWIANELSQTKIGLKAGEVITTGTCVIPFAIKPGDHIQLDFGVLGGIEARLV